MYQQYSNHGIGRAARAVSIAAGVTFLAACGGGSGSDSGSGTSSGSGSFSLGVTDAPVDEAESVFIEFSSVTLVPADGDDADDADADADDGNDGDDAGQREEEESGLVTIPLDGTQRIDLLDQQNGKRALLIEDEQIPAGEYEQIRLNVDSTTIVLTSGGGGEQDLFCPSCDQTGLKLNAEDGFVVSDGGALDLTIDFDLRKSIVLRGNANNNNGYLLKPTLRLVKTDETGEIAASATGTYIANNCADDDAQSVYVFEGADVTPDDIDGQDPEPVTTAMLTNEDADDTYTGTAAFLEPGSYTVAFTCGPEDDDPESDDELTFLDVRNLTVESGETAEYSLP